MGNVRVHRSDVRNGVSFTLATNFAYRDKDGSPNIETQWHNVLAWDGKNIQDISRIKKGDKVYVQGRMRYQHYTGTDGIDRVQAEVLASRLALIDDPDVLGVEM